MNIALTITLALVLVLVLLGLAIRGRSLYCRRLNNIWLKRFSFDSATNSYFEARQRIFPGQEYTKIPHAVLLLHGYSTSPRDFEILYPKLEKANIPYDAPVYTGFGLGDLQQLSAVKASDWWRDVLNAYDRLAMFSQNISVIGHSNGATLAFLLAQSRPVDQLILINPNLFIHPRSKRKKKLLNHPILGRLYSLLHPYFEKPILPGNTFNLDYADQSRASTTFHFPVLPITSFKAICWLQDNIDYKLKVHCKKMNILYGKLDRSVSNPEAFAKLEASNIPFTAYAYEKSAHQLLNDNERESAANKIIEILQDSINEIKRSKK